MTDNSFRRKKYQFYFKDIVRLELRKFKQWGKFDDYVFAIFFTKEGEERAIVIKHNMYFIKDIRELFDRMEKEHGIPYIKKHE